MSLQLVQQSEPEEHPGIRHAIRVVGSERKLAKMLSVSRGIVYLMRLRQRRITPEMALRIVQVTNNRVRKHELRPDLW